MKYGGKYGGPNQTRRAEFRGLRHKKSIGTNRIPWRATKFVSVAKEATACMGIAIRAAQKFRGRCHEILVVRPGVPRSRCPYLVPYLPFAQRNSQVVNGLAVITRSAQGVYRGGAAFAALTSQRFRQMLSRKTVERKE